jgi:Immunity protein 39
LSRDSIERVNEEGAEEPLNVSGPASDRIKPLYVFLYDVLKFRPKQRAHAAVSKPRNELAHCHAQAAAQLKTILLIEFFVLAPSRAHNRNLVIGTVALVMGRLRKDGTALDEVRDEVEQLMLSTDFLADAPFKFISLIIRYGLVNKTKPDDEPISKKYGDLPIAIELDMTMLKTAER